MQVGPELPGADPVWEEQRAVKLAHCKPWSAANCHQRLRAGQSLPGGGSLAREPAGERSKEGQKVRRAEQVLAPSEHSRNPLTS